VRIEAEGKTHRYSERCPKTTRTRGWNGYTFEGNPQERGMNE